MSLSCHLGLGILGVVQEGCWVVEGDLSTLASDLPALLCGRGPPARVSGTVQRHVTAFSDPATRVPGKVSRQWGDLSTLVSYLPALPGGCGPAASACAKSQ